MSTVERIEISRDEPGCTARIIQKPENAPIPLTLWYSRTSLDLCPTHVRERVERAAPPAAPTAGTTSTEGITLTLSAHEAVWVAGAMERHAHVTGVSELRRELIRGLHRQIEDYARSQP